LLPAAAAAAADDDDDDDAVSRSCSGTACPYANNTPRSSTTCINTTACPPRDCVGSWVSRNCSGACGGGGGLLLEEYVVTVTAAYNGEGGLRWILCRRSVEPVFFDCNAFASVSMWCQRGVCDTCGSRTCSISRCATACLAVMMCIVVLLKHAKELLRVAQPYAPCTEVQIRMHVSA
jgi:hypothetical protein